MKKAVISMAAGKSQLLIIKKAKELGYSVIGIDKDPNAVGFSECDEKINLSTYDSLSIIKHLKKISGLYDIKGVLNRSSGIPALTTAEICKQFNLPNVEPSAAEIIIDKSSLMAFCRENNISVPSSVSVDTIEHLNVEEINYPCVVKPSFSVYGKCGVTMVCDDTSLHAAIVQAKKYSEYGVVEIEEYIQGYDVTLMSVVNDGKIHVITLLDEENVVENNGEIHAKSYSVPSVFSGKNEETYIVELAKDLVEKFSIKTSMFLMSCRCEKNKKPYLIEIHLDFGGDLVLDNLIPASTDFDVLSYMILNLTGVDKNIPKIKFKPTAVIYDSDSKFGAKSKLIYADTQRELSELLNDNVSIC